MAGNPVNAVPVDLVDFWFYSVEHSDKAHVLNAAVQFLGSPPPPRASMLNGRSFASAPFSHFFLDLGDQGSVSETCSAWRKLKRTVTLWLGNAIVFLAEDHPWQEREAVSLATDQTLTTSDLLSAEVTQSPLLMSTISHFVHDLVTGSWETRYPIRSTFPRSLPISGVSRLAAAKALTCIAIQCQEPYRIQIYTVFKGLLPSADLFGLNATLSRVLELLDQMYAGAIMIDACVEQWGGNFASWPAEMAESVQTRHAVLLEEILRHCQVPTDLFFPLGPKSRALILGEDVPETLPRQTTVGFEPPQAQYSDYLRHGSVQFEEGYELEPNEEVSVAVDEEETTGFTGERTIEQYIRGSQRTREYMAGWISVVSGS